MTLAQTAALLVAIIYGIGLGFAWVAIINGALDICKKQIRNRNVRSESH